MHQRPSIKPVPLIWSREKSLLLALSGFYLISRLTNLTCLPLFVDEGVYIWWGERILQGDVVRGLGEGRPLIGWTTAMMLALGVDRIIAPRLVHVLLGGVTLLCLGLLARRFLSKSVAVIAMLLWIVLPYPLFFERLATPDAVMAALGLVTIYLSVIMAENSLPQGKQWLLPLATGVIIVLAMLAKMPVGIFFIIGPLAALLILQPADEWFRHRRQLIVCYALPGLFLGLVCTVVWIRWRQGITPLGFGFHLVLRQSNLSADNIDLVETGAVNLGQLLAWFAAYLSWPLLIGTMISWLVALIWGPRLLKLLALLSGTFIGVFLLLSDLMVPRYFLPALPPLVLILAWAFVASVDRLTSVLQTRWLATWPRRTIKYGLFSLAGIALFACVLPFDTAALFKPEATPLPTYDRIHYIEGFGTGYGFPEAAAYLETVAAGQKDDEQIIALHISDYARLKSYSSPQLHPKLRQVHIVDGRSRATAEQIDIMKAWLQQSRLTYIVVGHDHAWNNAWAEAFPKALLIGTFPKPGNLDSVQVYRLERP